jgi:hypothetical protein
MSMSKEIWQELCASVLIEEEGRGGGVVWGMEG